MSGYEIRQFHPADRDGIRSLYELVFEQPSSAAWFEWKYTDNPYFDGVPAVVATFEDRIVGARPFFALPIRAGGTILTALQPADAMVHSAHRRRGLFTRMTERALEWFAGSASEPSFCFNFPNERSLPGNLKLGWRTVGTVPTYYRIENAGAFIETDGFPAKLATAACQGFLRTVDTLCWSAGDRSIVRRSDVPAGTLASLYRRRVPRDLHAHRTAEFYRWRFANPNWEYTTYLAGPTDEPIAAVVVATGERDGLRLARLAEAVPLVRDAEARSALESLLAVVVEDVEADSIAAMGPATPHGSTRWGFLDDGRLPLSLVSSRTTMVARPIGATNWTVAGRDLTDPTAWRLSFVERDTG